MLSTRAFSLVELSVVLVIVGILSAGALSVGSTVVEQKRRVDTKIQLETVKQAIESYAKVNGRLPCVAPRDVAATNASAGVQVHSGNCDTNTAAPAGTLRTASGAQHVRTGAIPYKTLGLAESAGYDAWNNRYTYMVVEEATETTPLNALAAGHGGISVRDETGANVIYANALYAIISHGKDGKGSYKHLNGTLTSCDATALDKENCDSDIVIIDTAPNNSSIAANFYDDYVVWAPKYLLGISAAGSSPTTATALGYQLVNGTACNGASSCSATCPGGKVLIGGGCRGTNGSHVHPEDLYPFSTTQWRCRTAGAVTTLQAYAICITQ